MSEFANRYYPPSIDKSSPTCVRLRELLEVDELVGVPIEPVLRALLVYTEELRARIAELEQKPKPHRVDGAGTIQGPTDRGNGDDTERV